MALHLYEQVKPKWKTDFSSQGEYEAKIAKKKREAYIIEKGHGKVPAKMRNEIEKLENELYKMKQGIK